jgi:hypothetical protein
MTINLNTISSLGFFYLAYKAKQLNRKDVMYGCIISGIVSVLNHAHYGNNVWFRYLDIVVVNAIALYFLNNSRKYLMNMYDKNHLRVMMLGLNTIILYFIFRKNHDLYFVVHLSAFIGIWNYIKAEH